MDDSPIGLGVIGCGGFGLFVGVEWVLARGGDPQAAGVVEVERDSFRHHGFVCHQLGDETLR